MYLRKLLLLLGLLLLPELEVLHLTDPREGVVSRPAPDPTRLYLLHLTNVNGMSLSLVNISKVGLGLGLVTYPGAIHSG